MAARRVPWFLPSFLEVIMLMAFLSFSQQVTSYDLWWHLACGRDFAERGQVMTVDDLSTGSAGTYWTPHYWFWAVVAYQIYLRAGLLGVLLAKAMLAAFAVQVLGWLVREQGVRRELAFVGTVLLGIFGLFSQFWNLRAQNFTGFAVFFVTYLFLRARRTGRLPWLAAPLFMCLWTNTHGGFIFGIVVWGVFFTAACLRRLADRPTSLEPSKLLLLGLLMLAGCALNPYGPRYILYPFGYLGNVHLQTRITEWAGTVVRDYLSLEIVIVAVLACCALLPHASPMEEVALAGICLHFVFQAARNIFLTGPWLAPLVGPRLQAGLDLLESRPGSPGEGSTTAEAERHCEQGDRVGWAWIAIALVAAVRLSLGAPPPVRSVHPVQLVAWLQTRDVPKPLFNEYSQGGYIMFWLRGRYLPHTDGRADLHIDSGAFAEYTRIIDLAPGWEELFCRKRGFRSALLEAGMPLAAALRSRGWKPVGPDEKGFELLVAPRD